jgi:hypothetical protein
MLESQTLIVVSDSQPIRSSRGALSGLELVVGVSHCSNFDSFNSKKRDGREFLAVVNCLVNGDAGQL